MPKELSSLQAEGRILIISPHLDDAVLSCAGLLKFADEAIVVTVLAGDAPEGAALTDWDLRCGFDQEDNVMEIRREEDERALSSIGVRPRWLSERQDVYRTESIDELRVTRMLRGSIEELAPSHLALPLGLHHPDHKLVSDISFDAAREVGLSTVYLYADQPYAHRFPMATPKRLAELRAMGIEIRRERVPKQARHGVIDAVRMYETQLKGLEISTVRLRCIYQKYWRALL